MKTRIRATARAACFMVLGAIVLQMGAVVAQEQLLPFINGIDKTNRQQIHEVGIRRTARIDTLTATASGTLANSTVLDRGMNIVATVTTTGDSFTLPTLTGAVEIAIQNGGANSLNVFPNCSTCKIDTGSNGAAKAVAANKMAVFRQGADGLWYSFTSP